MLADKEIIKGLEICGTEASCSLCPYYSNGKYNKCLRLFKDALALISRQKEDIEKLTKLYGFAVAERNANTKAYIDLMQEIARSGY